MRLIRVQMCVYLFIWYNKYFFVGVDLSVRQIEMECFQQTKNLNVVHVSVCALRATVCVCVCDTHSEVNNNDDDGKNAIN